MPVDSVESARTWRVSRQNIAARKSEPKFDKTGGEESPAVIQTNEANTPDPNKIEEKHDKARTRREVAEANLAEMREAEQRGELIRIEAVKTELAHVFSTARDALLQIPSRLAPLLAADGDPASVQNSLHAEIHQALQHLADANVTTATNSSGLMT